LSLANGTQPCGWKRRFATGLGSIFWANNPDQRMDIPGYRRFRDSDRRPLTIIYVRFLPQTHSKFAKHNVFDRIEARAKIGMINATYDDV
jgi:hypothetical protein